MAKIAVEDSLTNVKQALQNNGHEVVSMDAANLSGCDCCVISGQDKDMMGMADTATKASVVNAQGITADEVVQQVNSRLR